MFTSTSQPTPEQKRQGLIRKFTGQKLAQEIMNLTFKGAPGSDIADKMRQYFGLGPQDDLSIEMVMHFRQVEKAIGKGDTAAYRAALERAQGMPRQVNQHIFEEGAVVKIGGKKLEP